MNRTTSTLHSPSALATPEALAPLLRDPRLAGADLISAYAAVGVTLSGTVANIWQYQTLRALLGRAAVVVDVGIVATYRPDAEIAAAMHDAIFATGASETVHGRVRGGIITLSGTTDASRRAALVAQIGTLPGITGIVDHLRLPIG